jgi:hypothetical protein
LECISSRRLTSQDDLIISHAESILIIDNGCDQKNVNINAFLIQSHAGIYYNVGGLLHAMTSSNLELVNDAFTLVTLPNNDKIIFHIN